MTDDCDPTQRLMTGEVADDEASLDSALRPTTLADYIGQDL
jgi:Holliday junction resolvasome RuvABC ATP-dependent DNA helicase subunit